MMTKVIKRGLSLVNDEGEFKKMINLGVSEPSLLLKYKIAKFIKNNYNQIIISYQE